MKGLECTAPVLCMWGLQICSPQTQTVPHMPQTNSCGCRHLVDYPDLHASLSSLEKQIQLLLPTSLSQTKLSSTEVFLL